MTWSIWKGMAEWACGRRQYSQQPRALWRTRVISAWFIAALVAGGGRLPDGAAGLGVQEVEFEADLAVVLQFLLLPDGELPRLVLDGEFLHPVEVLLVEGKLEEEAGGFRGHIVLVRAEEAVPDGGGSVRGVCQLHGHSSAGAVSPRSIARPAAGREPE